MTLKPLMSREQLFSNLPGIPFDWATEQKPILLLTHNDLDGAVPEVILRHLTKHLKVVHCSNASMDRHIHEAVLEHLGDYTFVIITDISCSKETADMINSSKYRTSRVLLLDHHASAEYLNDYSWACVYPYLLSDSFDAIDYPEELRAQGHCSASALLYNYVLYRQYLKVDYHKSLNRLVQLTSHYDTWDWVNIFLKQLACKDLNTLFNIYGIKNFGSIMFNRCIDNQPIVSREDARLLALEHSRIDSTINQVSKRYLCGDITIDNMNYSAVFCFSDLYPSEILADMRERFPDKDLFILRTSGSISIRTTRADLNVAEIAAKYDGGGHPQASGIPIASKYNIAFLEQFLGAAINIDSSEGDTI